MAEHPATDAPSEGVMQLLREGTREAHAALEALPFSLALQAGTLDHRGYVDFLRAMALLHEAVEGALDGSGDGTVAAVWHPGLRRLPALEEDLEALEGAQGGDPPVGRPELLAILAGEEARVQGARTPPFLLGWLYVLQGSVLGGRTVAGPVAKALGLGSGQGTAFLSGRGEGTPGARWREFGRRMDAALGSPRDREPALRGAVDAFRAFHGLFQALRPAFPSGPGPLAAVLNREAGVHRIPQDPLEIRAALRAGAASWERFPYYERRYGARGRRFTRSDSAWIVTLAGEPLDAAERELRWLGRFLAVRGMPRWLLEAHLEELHRELGEARPERGEAYAVLLQVARRLRAERLAILGPQEIASLTEAFEGEVPPAESAGLPWAGHILVAAVADEVAGITGAIRSVEGWMRDRTRFPELWARGVRNLLDRARERASPLTAPASGGVTDA
jgi:heme oxygenase